MSSFTISNADERARLAAFRRAVANARRDFMAKACGIPDCVGALVAAGYNMQAAHHEVIDWLRLRENIKPTTMVAIAFEDDNEEHSR